MKKYLPGIFLFFCSIHVLAHPMPGSVVELSVLENSISGEAKIPMLELGNAVGDNRLSNLNDVFFKQYFTSHITAVSNGVSWTTRVGNISVIHNRDAFVGDYEEAVVHFTLTPPESRYLHGFTLQYDAVIHQVVTHSALVYIRQDWSNGLQGIGEAQQIGVIQTDVPTGRIFPLQISLEKGSWYKGLGSMLQLGMLHIQEGTDHLLFLLVLLLPAMLVVKHKRWSSFGGMRYSIKQLLTIVTAFTIGHSVTLLAGAFGWFRLPAQPVEILIAVSIIVSAVHALRPIFPGKEMYVAAGFGLIHGLAFAAVLSGLQLGVGRLAISILGFNLGIELMQLLVIAVVVPWLILLSKTHLYKWLRTGGAIAAAIAALGWIAERSTGVANPITQFMLSANQHAGWCIAGLAVLSILIYSATAFRLKEAQLTI